MDPRRQRPRGAGLQVLPLEMPLRGRSRPKYRDPAVTEEWRKKDCVAIMEARLQEWNVLTAEEIQRIRDEINSEMDQAIAFAEASPEPTVEDLYRNLYAD